MYVDYLNGAHIKPSWLYYMYVIYVCLAKVVNHMYYATTKLHLSRKPKQGPLGWNWLKNDFCALEK